MSESGEKTEQPSPKKVRDAREKGQVARSQEAVTTFSLMAVVGYIWVTWTSTMQALLAMFNEVSSLIEGDFQVNAANAITLISRQSAEILLPLLGVTILAAIAANYIQVGTLFAFDSIMPKMDKISPAAGFKRIFSGKQLIETLKSVLKIVFLSILLYLVVRDAIGPYISSLRCGMPCMVNITSSVLAKLLLYSALAFIIVAGFDYVYQKSSHTKSLMMSKDDVKREYKESEGDPHIKGQRKQLAHEMVMSDGGQTARKATAVVVNPTHFAVVLKFDPETMALPAVVAKGRNQNAHYLRTEAESAGVPVFRNVGLARALFADAEINQFVPDDLFDAVAEVLVWVAKNKDLLYQGPLAHGVIDMDAGDHRNSGTPAAP